MTIRTVYEEAVINMTGKDIDNCDKKSNPEIFEIKELALAIERKEKKYTEELWKLPVEAVIILNRLSSYRRELQKGKTV